METNDIKELIELLAGTDVTELSYEKDGMRIRLKRGPQPMDSQNQGMAPPQGSGATGGVAPPSSAHGPDVHEDDLAGLTAVKSPIVGTFYRSSSPDSSPFVNVGDRVKKGQVLCVIEAMKLMNEIESETDGKVHSILVENSNAVEYGEILFYIEPI
ncbi:MAG: acetyl-CoA carboxylase biotin carboxyl carrier protein [Nitrospirae bacterium]|nr:acetyl-CoA carboxylase biotin carboxyl carrier protein [Nitrospirota bacterium]